VVGNGAYLGGGPPRKPPGPTLDHGLVSPIGWCFSDFRKMGEEWKRWREKMFFWKIPVSNVSKKKEIFIELG
jgi:hypothetical protein